jgi:hypothetical protein
MSSRTVRKIRKRQAMADVQVVCVELRFWDPMGLGTIARPDEYDAYAPHIVSLVAEGTTDFRLAHHLSSVQTEQMGVPATPALNIQVAQRIIAALRKLPA